MLSVHSARFPRGAQPTALLNCLPEFMLMAFMTMVEPSLMTRVSIRETRPNDHLNASTASSESVSFRRTSTQAVTKDPKRSVGIP